MQGAASDSPNAEGFVGDAPLAEGAIRDEIGSLVVSLGRWAQADLLFTENADDGAYEASFLIAPGMSILDVVLICGEVWSAPVVTLNAQDEEGTMYYDDLDLVATLTEASPGSAYPIAVSGTFTSLNLDGDGVFSAILSPGGESGVPPSGPGFTYRAADSLAFRIDASGGPVTPSGITIARVLYSFASVSVAADFTPA